MQSPEGSHTMARGLQCGYPDGHRGACRSIEAVRLNRNRATLSKRRRRLDPAFRQAENEKSRQRVHWMYHNDGIYVLKELSRKMITRAEQRLGATDGGL